VLQYSTAICRARYWCGMSVWSFMSVTRSGADQDTWRQSTQKVEKSSGLSGLRSWTVSPFYRELLLPGVAALDSVYSNAHLGVPWSVFLYLSLCVSHDHEPRTNGWTERDHWHASVALRRGDAGCRCYYCSNCYYSSILSERNIIVWCSSQSDTAIWWTFKPVKY